MRRRRIYEGTTDEDEERRYYFRVTCTNMKDSESLDLSVVALTADSTFCPLEVLDGMHLSKISWQSPKAIILFIRT